MSDILVARARELDGVSRPVTASFAVHVGLLVALAVLPSSWFAAKPAEKPMIINLSSGAFGPDPNGNTSIGAKKVDEAVAPKPRPEPIVPVTPKSTALAEPTKAPIKPATQAKPSPPSPAPASKPVTGAKVTPGNAVAATNGQAISMGLSSGGQGGSALDSNWCCPEWTTKMQQAINWTANQGISGDVVIEFIVEKDGTISRYEFKKRTGYAALDLDAQRALEYAKLPSLPPAYTGNRLTVTLTFPYIK